MKKNLCADCMRLTRTVSHAPQSVGILNFGDTISIVPLYYPQLLHNRLGFTQRLARLNPSTGVLKRTAGPTDLTPGGHTTQSHTHRDRREFQTQRLLTIISQVLLPLGNSLLCMGNYLTRRTGGLCRLVMSHKGRVWKGNVE